MSTHPTSAHDNVFTCSGAVRVAQLRTLKLFKALMVFAAFFKPVYRQVHGRFFIPVVDCRRCGQR